MKFPLVYVEDSYHHWVWKPRVPVILYCQRHLTLCVCFLSCFFILQSGSSWGGLEFVLFVMLLLYARYQELDETIEVEELIPHEGHPLLILEHTRTTSERLVLIERNSDQI